MKPCGHLPMLRPGCDPCEQHYRTHHPTPSGAKK